MNDKTRRRTIKVRKTRKKAIRDNSAVEKIVFSVRLVVGWWMNTQETRTRAWKIIVYVNYLESNAFLPPDDKNWTQHSWCHHEDEFFFRTDRTLIELRRFKRKTDRAMESRGHKAHKSEGMLTIRHPIDVNHVRFTPCVRAFAVFFYRARHPELKIQDGRGRANRDASHAARHKLN